MSTWRLWWTDRNRPGRSTWREFLSDPDNRAAVLNLVARHVLNALSSVLPALAVAAVIRVVTGYGSHTPGVDFGIWVVTSAIGYYVYFRIARWHDRQDRIERQRSEQEN